MIIGSLVEIKDSEERVGLLPIHAKDYIDNGHEVIVESGLGVASGYSDSAYEEVGVKVVTSAKEVWAKADMIVKVKEPLASEYDFIRKGQIIYTYFHLAADKTLTEVLVEKGASAVAYETIENNLGQLVLLKPMSEIAGKLAILEANKYLESHFGGKGVLLSGATNINSGHVVILGVGSVGYSALNEAYNLGASISALVKSEFQKTHLENLFDNNIDVYISTEENIIKCLKKADVVVSSVLVAGEKAQQLIKREHLKYLEPGSIIIDVAIDQGGSTETSRPTTHSNPIYKVDGILHYCVSNMGGAVPRTSSIALGNATIKYGLDIANKGLLQAISDDEGLYKGVNIYNHKVTNKAVAKTHSLKFEKLEI